MKIKILNILTVMLLGMLVMFSSCEDKDDYNYNNIEPIIFSVTGPGVAAAHGLTEFPYRYHVPFRGGSKFDWTITSPAGTATYVKDAQYESIIYATFPQSSDTSAATITVVETTMGGKSSPAFSRNIVLTPFCPYDMDALVGNWTGTSGANDDPLVANKTSKLNELVVKGLAGFVNFSWGENWTKGNGSALLEFDCGEIIKIAPQWIGDTDYPDSYGIIGSGTFNPANQVITLTYQVYWGWTGTSGNSAIGVIQTVLTKSGKVLSHKVLEPIPNKHQ
jgi:hypothetical protein